MVLPTEVPVMTLSNAILFPHAFLPLYIYEKKYQKMLADSLLSERMFAVALRKPGSSRETPSNVAGLGLIRACVDGTDGTSHLILQGLTRVRLGDTTRYRPYRIQKIHPLRTTGNDSVAVDALTAKLVDLVAEKCEQGLNFPSGLMDQLKDLNKEKASFKDVSLNQLAHYLKSVDNPDYLADLVSCTLLQAADQRQMILETPDLEARLKHLIHFLIAGDESGDASSTNE